MAKELERFINKNRDGFDKAMPDPAVLSRILDNLEIKEEPKRQKGILISFRAIQWAAAVVVILGGSITWWLVSRPEVAAPAQIAAKPRQEIKKIDTARYIAAAPEPKAATGERSGVEEVDRDMARRKQILAASLKERARVSKKQVIFAGLNDMESPASRMAAAAKADELKNIGNDVVDALVETLNTDPSPNVRLAALDGLAKFYREDYVREKLVGSLKKQQVPLVQIALIELLTRMRASGILSELEKLAGDETNLKAVRDCAYSNMFRLRSS